MTKDDIVRSIDMKQVELNKRVVGFFQFEHRFLKESNHCGFVKHLGNGALQLVSHPLMRAREDTYEYRLPNDITLFENELVELSVGTKKSDVETADGRTGWAKKYKYYYEVEDANRISYSPPKPNLSSDDFLHRLIGNWRDADIDEIHRSIALQVLSCPPNTVPVGGLGSQTLHYGSRKSPINDLRKTIAMSLPKECFSRNEVFLFGMVQKPTDNSHLLRCVANQTTPEISYNYMTIIKLSGKPLPIAVPTLIENARCTSGRWEPDPDVLEYVLLSHFLQPTIDDETVNHLIRCMKETREELSPSFLKFGISIDSFSVNRVAQAFCRLDFKNSVDADVIRKASGWIRSEFKRYYEAITDVFETEGDAYREPRPAPVSVYENLPRKERAILKGVVLIHSEENKEVSVEALSVNLAGQYNHSSIEDGLRKLYMEGFVINSPSGKGYLPVVFDE